MTKEFPLLLWAAVVLLLSGCDSPEVKSSKFLTASNAKDDFAPLAEGGAAIFWQATDQCLRENSGGMSQMTTFEDFTKKHSSELVEVKQVYQKRSRVFQARVKIHDPETPLVFYELVFEEGGKGWQAIDGFLMVEGHEMNYFEGGFLSATNLKPYVDEASAKYLAGELKVEKQEEPEAKTEPKAKRKPKAKTKPERVGAIAEMLEGMVIQDVFFRDDEPMEEALAIAEKQIDRHCRRKKLAPIKIEYPETDGTMSFGSTAMKMSWYLARVGSEAKMEMVIDEENRVIHYVPKRRKSK